MQMNSRCSPVVTMGHRGDHASTQQFSQVL